MKHPSEKPCRTSNFSIQENPPLPILAFWFLPSPVASSPLHRASSIFMHSGEKSCPKRKHSTLLCSPSTAWTVGAGAGRKKVQFSWALFLGAAICFGNFFPFFFGIFSRFLGLDGFHCVLQASSLNCIVLLHVGPQKVVVSQAMLHAKTQHLPPKQNDNTYCHQQGYRQKHLYISVSIYIYI